MANRKITVEIEVQETDMTHPFAFMETQTFHDNETGETLGSLFTEFMSGNNVIIKRDDSHTNKCWKIDKDQFAKIFTAILLQKDEPEIKQEDLDEIYKDFMGDKL